jgi:uridine kinase
MSDEIHDAVLAEIATRAQTSEPRTGRTRILAIDGLSGSGKSTLARELAGMLDARIVQLEQLYPGWDGLQDGIDVLVQAVLEPIAKGQAAHVPRYDWIARDYGDPWTLEPPEILIVEGVGAGAAAAARFASVLVWLEMSSDRRKERALARDGDLFRPHWDRWAAQERTLLERERTAGRADFVIDLDLP